MSEANSHQKIASTKHHSGWRLRWSLRLLIVFVTFVGVLCAWGAHRYRIGQMHDAVGRSLETIGSRAPTYSSRETNSIGVQWELTRPVHYQTISDRNWNPFLSRPTNIVVHKRLEKYSPNWMKTTGTDLLFQRIRSIRLDANLTPMQVATAIDEIVKLDSVEAILVATNHLSHEQFSLIVQNVNVKELSAPKMKIEPGPIPGLRHSSLVSLNLSHTWFSDAVVAELPASLEVLNLERTAITDVGLANIPRLTNLKTLNLQRTPTSDRAIEQLRAQMPWCEISWEPLLPKHMTQR